MVVPYGDPAYPHYKKNAFDGGEDGKSLPPSLPPSLLPCLLPPSLPSW